MEMNIKVVEKSSNAKAFINLECAEDILEVIYKIATGEYQLRQFTNKSGKTSYAVEPA